MGKHCRFLSRLYRMPRIMGIAAFLLIGSSPNAAHAQSQAPITLNVNGSTGWISGLGRHDMDFPSYATGYSPTINTFTNSWFAFTLPTSQMLPPLNNRIFTSATLVIDAGTYAGQLNQSETVEFFDVNPGTTIADLNAARPTGNLAGQALFNDLGSGVSYGSVTVSAANNATLLSIPLNQAALDRLNSSRGQPFLIGGTLTSFSGNTFPGEVVFGITSSSLLVRRLVVVASVAPEPGSLALLLTLLSSAAVFGLLQTIRLGKKMRIRKIY